MQTNPPAASAPGRAPGAAPLGDRSAAFEIPVRVYYEDTDAGGVVYYANYLKFLERARTERFRAAGFEQRGLREEQGVLFAVRHVEIEYLRPALFDDALHVSAEVTAWRRSALRFHQRVRRAGEWLTAADVLVVCVDARCWRPCAIPTAVKAALATPAD